jgi:demethylmenaquinone methyltransferase/2-methoxy-6-polyprenyl-1,4-benzoquinol methylase
MSRTVTFWSGRSDRQVRLGIASKNRAPDIYDAGFVERLFDEMSGTYERVNYLSSFGFSRRWREQFVGEAFVGEASIGSGMTVCDLMCGVGECWEAIYAHLGGSRLVALDFSGGMLRLAERRRAKSPDFDVTLRREDALASSLGDGYADRIVCGFGVKTLSDEQREVFASEVARLLRPGGSFSLVEVSVPRGWWLRVPYMLYLKYIIPIIGWVLLGNPENYRMLGVYTERFGNCRRMRDALVRNGLHATYHEYFFGCASGVSGSKP